MAIYALRNGKFTLLESTQLKKESKLQKLIEDNLPELLCIHRLGSQIRTSWGGRIDTLGIDYDGAPAIVEYKLDRDDSIIPQVLSYMKWLTEQPEELFRLLVEDRLGKEVADSLRLNWQNPRAICIAKEFSRFDIDAAQMSQAKVDLFTYELFGHDLIRLDRVNIDRKGGGSAYSAQFMSEDTRLSLIEGLKEQANASSLIDDLYDELRIKILELAPGILEKPAVRDIGYSVDKYFAKVQIKSDRLVITLRSIDFEDPRNMVESIAEGYSLTLNRRLTISCRADIDYAVNIISQSYQDVL